MTNNKKGIYLIIIVLSQILVSSLVFSSSLFPVISNIHHTPVLPTPEDVVTVLADITHSEGLSVVQVKYLTGQGKNWKYLNMKNYFRDTFYVQLPKQQEGTIVTYQILAIAINGFTQVSHNHSYTVHNKNVPLIKNINREPVFPKYDEQVNISAEVYDLSGIEKVFLHYQFGEGEETIVNMGYNISTGICNASIPPPFGGANDIGEKVTYWIEAKNKNLDVITSSKQFYIILGSLPILYEVWTEPYQIVEGTTVSFYATLFSRAVIANGSLFYRIDGGEEKALVFTQTDYMAWSSEPLPLLFGTGGKVLEYWCQFNYSVDGTYQLYPSSPMHYYKTIGENNNPIIENINLSPSSVRKGDMVEINVTIREQSTVTSAECIISVPGVVNDSTYMMNKVTGTEIWRVILDTKDLPEDSTIVVTIRITDLNGLETLAYSGFFLNDGTPPVLYNIEDLRNQPICHTQEHVLYLYANDTSEITYVELHLWVNNGTEFYEEYNMTRGGEHLYFFDLNMTNFSLSLSTWISYDFEVEDVNGYKTASEMFYFYVWDYTGPVYLDYYCDSVIGYLEQPVLKVKVGDQGGSGVQSVSLIYSDNNWETQSSLSMSYEGENWWKCVNIPTLELGKTRRYYYSSLDMLNNPSQSIEYTYVSEDIYPPDFQNYEFNDGAAITDQISNTHIELWLNECSGVNINSVNFHFHSTIENQDYVFPLYWEYGFNPYYFDIDLNYDWIGGDLIIYYFEASDGLGNLGETEHLSFTVVDTSPPSINPSIIEGGGAWKDTLSQDEDFENVYLPAWLLDFCQDLQITVEITDAGVINEARLYYNNDNKN